MPVSNGRARGGQDSFIAGILDDDDDVDRSGLAASTKSLHATMSNRNLRPAPHEETSTTGNYASLPVTSTRRLPHDIVDYARTPMGHGQSSRGSHDSSERVQTRQTPANASSHGEDDVDTNDDDGSHYHDENALFDSAVSKGVMEDKHIMQQAQPLFRYALIFINFSFVVAAMLMIMAGVVARENSAVKLCGHCGELTTVALVFGILLWIFALFGFNWIRQHNILLLLVYAVFLVLLTLVLIVIIITGGAYDAEAIRAKDSGDSSFLASWVAAVTSNSTQDIQRICDLEVQLNCSGFFYGCCVPGLCFPNVTANGTEIPPPVWFDDICPSCPAPSVPKVCTDEIYSTVRKNLGGFLVISAFSLMLLITGVMLAVLSRKVNLLLDAAAGNVLEIDGRNPSPHSK